MAIELELTEDDIRSVLSDEEVSEIEGDSHHLGQVDRIGKVAAVMRAAVVKVGELAPEGFTVSKCSFEIKLSGCPFGVGISTGAHIELTPS